MESLFPSSKCQGDGHASLDIPNVIGPVATAGFWVLAVATGAVPWLFALASFLAGVVVGVWRQAEGELSRRLRKRAERLWKRAHEVTWVFSVTSVRNNPGSASQARIWQAPGVWAAVADRLQNGVTNLHPIAGVWERPIVPASEDEVPARPPDLVVCVWLMTQSPSGRNRI